LRSGNVFVRRLSIKFDTPYYRLSNAKRRHSPLLFIVNDAKRTHSIPSGDTKSCLDIQEFRLSYTNRRFITVYEVTKWSLHCKFK